MTLHSIDPQPLPARVAFLLAWREQRRLAREKRWPNSWDPFTCAARRSHCDRECARPPESDVHAALTWRDAPRRFRPNRLSERAYAWFSLGERWRSRHDPLGERIPARRLP